ncbi:MAG: GNAT family N-acetyltransferase [Christensenellaceae bacterium]|nr:GNAT family N-acetyltransferase [Christensenellaceae bacterium]
MGDVGGTHEFPESRWAEWFARNVSPSDGRNRFFLILSDGEPVGEISFHRYNPETRTADFNLKIEAAHRGKGFAAQALTPFLAYYFDVFGGETLLDAVVSPSGKAALPKIGFRLAKTEGNIAFFELQKAWGHPRAV